MRMMRSQHYPLLDCLQASSKPLKLSSKIHLKKMMCRQLKKCGENKTTILIVTNRFTASPPGQCPDSSEKVSGLEDPS